MKKGIAASKGYAIGKVFIQDVALRRGEGERIFVETGDEDENHSTCG